MVSAKRASLVRCGGFAKLRLSSSAHLFGLSSTPMPAIVAGVKPLMLLCGLMKL